QDQRVDIRGQGVADAREHGVVALAGILGHHVADIVDHVGIVAAAARHLIGAAAAVEAVGAGVAEQLIVAAEAGQTVVGAVAIEPIGIVVAGGVGRGGRPVAAGAVGVDQQHQGLDIARQGIAHVGVDGVITLVGVLDHHVAGIVHVIGVVAGAPGEGV